MNMDFTKFSFYNHLTDSEKELFEKSVSFQLVEKGTKLEPLKATRLGCFLLLKAEFGYIYTTINQERSFYIL